MVRKGIIMCFTNKKNDEIRRLEYIVDCLDRDREGIPHGGFIGGVPERWDLSILKHKEKK